MYREIVLDNDSFVNLCGGETLSLCLTLTHTQFLSISLSLSLSLTLSLSLVLSLSLSLFLTHTGPEASSATLVGFGGGAVERWHV